MQTQTIFKLKNVNDNYDILCSSRELAEKQKKIEIANYAGSDGWDAEDDWEIEETSMIIA